MTHAQSEGPTLYLKQVPKAAPNAEGVWAPFLLADHFTVCRDTEPPAGEPVYHSRDDIPQDGATQ